MRRKLKTPHSHICISKPFGKICGWTGFNPQRHWWIGFISPYPAPRCPICYGEIKDNPDYVQFQKDQSVKNMKEK